MRPKKTNISTFFISLFIAGMVLYIGLAAGETVTVDVAVKKLLFPLARLLFFITLGLVLGQVIEATGWTRQLSVVARPLFRFSNLGNRCSSAFTAAFISGVTANAMLLDFYKEKKITKTQLFLTNYVNQLPAFFLHLPTTFFIVIPLTGAAGVLYFALTLGAALLRTLCFFIFGAVYPPLKMGVKLEKNKGVSVGKEEKEKRIVEQIKAKLPKRITAIAVYVIPIYTLVFVLNAHGFFSYLNNSFSRFITISFMPVESLSVVMLSFAAEFTSGFAAAGALMDAGVLTTKQTVLALLLGNVTAFPIRALRHQLPRYMGIFSPKMGLQLLLTGQFFRVTSILIVGLIYYRVA